MTSGRRPAARRPRSSRCRSSGRTPGRARGTRRADSISRKAASVDEVVADAVRLAGRISRVVCETDTPTCRRAPTSALTRLVLPAPEGADTVYRVPGCGRFVSMSGALTRGSGSARASARSAPSIPRRSGWCWWPEDLDDRVLASRLSSCMRKSRRRPQGPPLSSTRPTSSTWASQAVQLLVHVGLLREQHQLLLQALRVQRPCPVPPGAPHALVLLGQQLGHALARAAVHLFLDGVQALADEARASFSPLRGRGCRPGYPGRARTVAGARGLRASVLATAPLEDAGPLQQLQAGGRRGIADGAPSTYLRHGGGQLRPASRGRFHFHSPWPRRGPASATGTSTLPRDRRFCRRLAQRGFEAAQRLRQLEMAVQVAVIDRANLHNQAAGAGLVALPGEGGHAVDHSCGPLKSR